jgi:ABC-type Fe3+-siderophore transport system permease subunit
MKSACYVVPLLIAIMLLFMLNAEHLLPFAQWWQAASMPQYQDIHQVVFHYTLLPRLSVALLAGAGLALCGLLFQQVLRNPLAEPTTLGVAAGARLGLTLATLFALPEWLYPLATLCGGLFAALLVLSIAWKSRFSPLTLILAGMVVGLYCAACNGLLGLFNYQRLQNIFLWSSGVLNQQDWRVTWQLLPWLSLSWLLALCFHRPLLLLGMDDVVAQGVGLHLALVRLGVLLLAVLLSAQLVNAVGVVGFIGLFAPWLVRLAGVRRLVWRLVLVPICGALLLAFTDQCVQLLAYYWQEIPTGSVTALIGAPLLLLLLPQLSHVSLNKGSVRRVLSEHVKRPYVPVLITALLLLALLLAILCGRDMQGWHWQIGHSLTPLLPWRLPRVLVALCAGMLLASSGVLMQKLTANPMAGPEVLGISSGAALGIALMLFIVPGDAFLWLLPAGALGATLAFMLITLVSGIRHFSATRLLLAGVAVSTLCTTLLVVLMASGDPRLGHLLSWLSGSTYGASWRQAAQSLTITLLLLVMVPFCQRPLALLPFGNVVARGWGLALTPARFSIFVLAALMTACATLTVGPLSFIGLMAPHLAYMLGMRKPLNQWWAASLLGGALLVFADWCGRMVLFPQQIPAGLLSTLIGVPYFLFLLYRQKN